jgi:hypothetical protein
MAERRSSTAPRRRGRIEAVYPRGRDSRSARIAAAQGGVAAAWALTGCILLVSTDGYAGPDEPTSPDAEGGPIDRDGSSDVADGPSTSDAATVIPGLLAAWSFDEGAGTVARDSTPRHNDGALMDGAKWVPGKIGQALAFDGVTSRVMVARHPSFEVTTVFTLAYWANLDEVAYDQRVFANGYSFSVKVNNRHMQLDVGAHSAYGSYVLPIGQWHHFAVTFDLGKVVWYVDGFAMPLTYNTMLAGDRSEPDSFPLYIGTSSSVSSSTLGKLDEVRLYSRVLTPAEIVTIAAP